MATITCLFAFAACGSEEAEPTIPRDQGDEILAQLEQLEEQVNAGECDLAEQTALGIQTSVQNLPQQVDGELRSTLAEASGKLVQQTRDPNQCEEVEEPPVTGPSGVEGVQEDEG